MEKNREQEKKSEKRLKLTTLEKQNKINTLGRTQESNPVLDVSIRAMANIKNISSD